MQASLIDPLIPCVDFLASVGAGQVKGLRIAGGLPVLDPPPTVIRRVDFGPGPDLTMSPRHVFPQDIVLTVPMVQFLWTCRQIGEGVIDTLYVKHGLPTRMYFQGRPVTTSDAWELLELSQEGGACAASA